MNENMKKTIKPLPPLKMPKGSGMKKTISGLNPLGGHVRGMGADPLKKTPASNKPSYYDIARAKVLQKRLQQKAMKAKISDGGLSTGGTGSGFTESGMKGSKLKLKKHILKKRHGAYENIGKKEGDILYNIISKKVKSKGFDKDITAYDKKEMRAAADAQYHAGIITKEDLKDFKNIINSLKK